jgi:hypothetical protein
LNQDLVRRHHLYLRLLNRWVIRLHLRRSIYNRKASPMGIIYGVVGEEITAVAGVGAAHGIANGKAHRYGNNLHKRAVTFGLGTTSSSMSTGALAVL